MTDVHMGSGAPAASAPPRRRRRKLTGFWLALPAWILLILVAVVPIATTLYLSLTSENLARPAATHLVGIDNYVNRVLTPDFLHAVWITILIAVGGLLVQVPLGLGLAFLVNRGLRLIPILRPTLLVPMMLTPVAVGLMWTLLLNPDIGIVNQALGAVGLPRPNWLGKPDLALLAIVLVSSWQNTAFVMLMFTAGLASLPREPQEAAKIDGATAWQSFRYVILPMLAPVVLVILLIRLIDAAKMFDLIIVLTAGGPGRATENLNLVVYKTAFTNFTIGQGAALAVALGAVLAPLYALWLRVTRT